MITMNSRIHFQGVASAARSLFELLLDLKILANDTTGEFVAKFHAFPEIEKFRVAKKIVSFCDAHQNDTKLDDSYQRAFINEPNRQQAVHQTVIKYWGKNKRGEPNFPKHWTGKDVRKRAHDLSVKYEEKYIQVYPFLSWFIHPGSTAYVKLNEEQIETSLGYCHSIAQQVFLEATQICAQEIKISKVVDWFHDAIDHLQLIPGKVIVDEQIKMLEESKEKLLKD